MSETNIYISAFDHVENQGHMYDLDLETMDKSELNLQGHIATGLTYTKRIEIMGRYFIV